jgi:hypothetical protein
MDNARLTRHRRQMLLYEKRKRGRMSNYNSIQTIDSTGEIMREDETIYSSENDDILSKLLTYNYFIREYKKIKK